jgi:hypothetical protein
LETADNDKTVNDWGTASSDAAKGGVIRTGAITGGASDWE